MKTHALLLLCAISSILWLAKLPPLWLPIGIGLISLVVMAWLLMNSNRWASKYLGYLATISLGIAYVSFFVERQLAWHLPTQWIAKTVQLEGRIQSIHAINQHHVNFVLHVKQLQNENISSKVRLNWYFLPNQRPNLQVGEYWHLQVRLKSAHGFANPGGFDYEKWLLGQGIRATGYVVSKPQDKNYRLQESKSMGMINHWRQQIEQRILQQIHKREIAALMIGLAVGIRDHISIQQWQILKNTGTSHLMAISGLHIGLIAGLAFLAIRFFWRCIPRASLYLAAPSAAAIAALIAAIFYAGLAGFSIPTQRALIMLTIVMIMLFFRRHLHVGQSLAIALILVLLLQPLSVLTIGFWLSFLAVFYLLYGLTGRLQPGKLWKLIQPQWVIMVGFIPLSLLFFQQLAIGSPLINAIAIPWVGLISLPLILLGAIGSLLFPDAWLAHLSLQLADWSLRPIWQLLVYIANYPLAVWQQGIEHAWLLFTSSIGSLILLLPRGFPSRWIGLIWLLPLISPVTKPNANSFWLTILDVGQGLSVVVETRHHVLVYDTGPKLSANFNVGDAVLIPFLRQRNIDHIDRVIISHADLDHRGGLPTLIKQFTISDLLTSEPKKINVNTGLCLAGQHWQWDGVALEVLYPSREKLGLVNNSSCVVRIGVGQHHVLLVGDIEKAAEQYLVKHSASQLAADILIVPHHGSRTSSTLDFIKAVNPKYAIFSSGYYNRFHFPAPSVVQRYHQQGIITLNTADTGSISFKIYADNPIYFPEIYRLQHTRVWRQSFVK